MLFGLSIMLGCGGAGGNIVGEVGRQELGVSVLAVNLRNAYDVPCGPAGARYEERYRRIGRWMKDSGNRPDIIALQEAPGWWSCPGDHRLMPDYAGMDVILDEIRDATGEQYRIAYLVSGKLLGGLGGCSVRGVKATGCLLWGELALLYRPSTMRNALATTNDLSISTNDNTETGAHLRRSMPCCNPARDRADVCSFIDGPPQIEKCGHETPSGLTWVQRQAGRTDRGFDAAFSRFGLVKQPGAFIHIYNVHLSWDAQPKGPQPGIDSINALVDTVEAKFLSGDRLYPPLLTGDFNLDQGRIAADFPRFDVHAWTPEVMGALIGKAASFSSKQTPFPAGVQVLPGPGCEDNGGATEKLWSDHCALFFRIEPVPAS